MPTYALIIEYDGTSFVGWQRQQGAFSVQQLLEEAVAPLNEGRPGVTTVAGRTDSGVHARAQVAQLTISSELSPVRLREAINARTRPFPVSVLATAFAPEGWNARFSATSRTYCYRILNRRSRPALLQNEVWHVPQRLDAASMHVAAQQLLGHHDFTSFRASTCQASGAHRTLDQLDVVRHGEMVEVIAEARSFLHHQVRNLVGTLAQVGLGRRPIDWPKAALIGRNRSLAGPTAPAGGLCLMNVRYAHEPDWQ